MKTTKFFIFLTYLFLFYSETYCQSGEFHEIEIGISYDYTFSSQFASKTEAENAIEDLVQEVNCIYENLAPQGLIIQFTQTGIHEIEVNQTNNYTKRDAASNFWKLKVDLCNKHDMVHHITRDIAGADGIASGASEAICGVGPTTNASVCAISEFKIGNFQAAALNMAHELGHNLGMGHEETLSTSFMDSIANVLSKCDFYTLSGMNFNRLKNRLNNKPCTKEKNVTALSPECPNCANHVIITSQSDATYYLDYGCETNDYIFDLSSIFSNNCEDDKDYSIEIYYHDQFIEILEAENFDLPITTPNSSSFNTIQKTKTLTLPLGEGSTNMLKIRVKGTGEYPTSTPPNGKAYTKFSLTYKLNKNEKIIDTYRGQIIPSSNVLNIVYVFYHNYQMDLRGKPIVFASDMTVPDPANNLDFCYGNIKKDIYIDGNFEVNINQKYCYSNFYFGPNSKLIVKANRTLELNNSLLTACKEQWQGIVLEAGAKLIVNGTTIDNVVNAISSIERTASLQISTNSKITNFDTGINFTNARINKFENVQMLNGKTGVYLYNSGMATFTNVRMDNIRTSGIKSRKTSISVSNCKIYGKNVLDSKGIDTEGTGHILSVNNNSEIKNWGVGILFLRTTLSLQNSFLVDNTIACYQSNSPGLIHSIKQTVFNKGSYGFQSINSDLNDESEIYECTFKDFNIGLSISSKPDPRIGWYINSDFSNVGQAGIRLTNAEGNYVGGCNLTGLGLPNSSLIKINGGSLNNISNNVMTAGASASAATQANGLEVNSAITSVFCNHVSGGSHGYNFWGNSPTYYGQNDVTKSQTGLYLGLYPDEGTALIGEQPHRYNTWANGTMPISAKHLSSSPSFVLESKFLVKEGLSQIYIPDPRVAVTNEWFTKEISNSIPQNCWDFNPDNPNPAAMVADTLSTDLFANLVNKSIPFGDWSDEIYANTHLQLYKLCIGATHKVKNQALSAQFIQNITPAIANIYKAELLISGSKRYHHLISINRAALDIAKTGTVISTESSGTRSWQVLDSMMVAGYQQAQLLHHQDIAVARQLLQEITETLSPIDNYKKLLLIKADMMQYGDISQVQKQTLVEIAQQCPLSGGNAVYEARDFVETTNGIAAYDDAEACRPVLPRGAGRNMSELSIYPNPATDKITLSGMRLQSLQVCDIAGKPMIGHSNIDKDEYTIDISSLPNGVYMIKAEDNKGNKSHPSKFIKIK